MKDVWIDVENARSGSIREGVGVHAFNGESFVQPVWDTESTQLFRTRFKGVKRVDTWTVEVAVFLR